MKFNLIAISLALALTCYAKGPDKPKINKNCRNLTEQDAQVCRDPGRSVLCPPNDFLGAFGGCCETSGCGISVSKRT
ncbi:hypothetical protein PoMZ_00822 [Pyricularia oryzae]|uniref:Uncharacterized protein n=1 Tax=Pyricularia oryzae TaxID=318829 RepID=A0A4P7N573_PYROR|nr:hypothetical protein PoMZ_00822 [Pyricularia oryzae]